MQLDLKSRNDQKAHFSNNLLLFSCSSFFASLSFFQPLGDFFQPTEEGDLLDTLASRNRRKNWGRLARYGGKDVIGHKLGLITSFTL
ncbi:hypothetical protein PanWU01x14_336370 [Parasponia andersonii]|uniref:Uncharacterized protein n=1 Tax=Parasponia andersonii TaxID=3476 RepID=A0A2P5AFY3_PARAD|nr:hypothetical protein PanWU01x14_336370 [Parasponia andersonii]